MRLFRFVLFVVAASAVTSQAYGQPDWQFTRRDGAGVFVTSGEFPVAGSDQNTDFDQATGDILVAIATDASASDSDPPGSAFAQSTSMAEAMNLTPVGATTFVPTVDTTVSHSDIAMATSPKSAMSRLNVEGGTNAFSKGSYDLEGTTTTSGFLQGNIYLLGVIGGSETGDGQYRGSGFVQAVIENFFVEAQYFDTTELWGVDVSLPDVTESFFTPSLNHFFTFTIPITLPRTIDI